MPLGAIIAEGAIFRLSHDGAPHHGIWQGSLWRAGQCDATGEFSANQLIKQSAKLVTNAEDVTRKLPAPVRAALEQLMQPETGQANLLVAASLNPSEKKLYDLLSSDKPQPIDDIVEQSGLNSSEVLATLFNLEMKGIVRQLPEKLFSKVLL
jgi:DNA processing protein